MARRIGVSRSSAFRLVHTLQRLGIRARRRDEDYRLGARVMSLGYSFLASKILPSWRGPICSVCGNATLCSTTSHLDGAE